MFLSDEYPRKTLTELQQQTLTGIRRQVVFVPTDIGGGGVVGDVWTFGFSIDAASVGRFILVCPPVELEPRQFIWDMVTQSHKGFVRDAAWRLHAVGGRVNWVVDDYSDRHTWAAVVLPSYAMTMPVAIGIARIVDRRVFQLTQMQKTVLLSMCGSSSVSRVARDLGISASTVQTHLHRARARLNMPDVYSMVRWAIAEGDAMMFGPPWRDYVDRRGGLPPLTA